MSLTIKHFQSKRDLKPYKKRKKTTGIIIHCSDSEHAKHDNPQTIEDWHVARGFNGIGYNYIITKNGWVWVCRGRDMEGAHCKGKNGVSIGICLTGRYEFSVQQKDALEDLLAMICTKEDISVDCIKGHKYFDPNKDCPNFDVDDFVERRLK